MCSSIIVVSEHTRQSRYWGFLWDPGFHPGIRLLSKRRLCHELSWSWSQYDWESLNTVKLERKSTDEALVVKIDVVFVTSYSNRRKKLKLFTWSENASKDPALAVLNGGAFLCQVLLQDLHAATPLCWTSSIQVISWPVSLQDTLVIKGVYLDKWTKWWKNKPRITITALFVNVYAQQQLPAWQGAKSDC